MGRRSISIAIIILAVIIFIALYPYLFIFSTNKFSKNISDWANAATWFNLFISTITAILILYLTWRIHKNEEKRETENQLFLKSLERPVVICKSKKKKKMRLVEKWGLTNVGKGAALNLRINYKENQNSDWQDRNTKCYSLIPNIRFELNWIKYVYIICVFYEDVLGNKYVTIGINDESFQEPLNDTYKTIQINKDLSFSYQEILSVYQKQTQRIYEAQDINSNNGAHGTSGKAGKS